MTKEVQNEDKPKRKLLPNGQYNGVVSRATDTVSKGGNPMMRVSIQVLHEGVSYLVYDYLLKTIPSMAYKLKGFCEALDLQEEYKNNTIADYMAQGKDVCVQVTTQVDDTGEYPPKNVINKYLKPAEVEVEVEVVEDEKIIEDEIPF